VIYTRLCSVCDIYQISARSPRALARRVCCSTECALRLARSAKERRAVENRARTEEVRVKMSTMLAAVTRSIGPAGWLQGQRLRAIAEEGHKAARKTRSLKRLEEALAWVAREQMAVMRNPRHEVMMNL
jgi:hypothetical protein